jgi:hypothetical protein
VYGLTIQAIAQRYGIEGEGEGDDNDNEQDQGEYEDEDEDLVEMNDEEIWAMIQEWTNGTLTHEALIRHIDFQYGKHAKIQYWEDVISTLTREAPPVSREEMFNSMPMEEHIRRLSGYQLPPFVSLTSASPPSPSHAPSPFYQHDSLPGTDTDAKKLWLVKILPCESVRPF